MVGTAMVPETSVIFNQVTMLMAEEELLIIRSLRAVIYGVA
jgi:hypothetical protein